MNLLGEPFGKSIVPRYRFVCSRCFGLSRMQLILLSAIKDDEYG